MTKRLIWALLTGFAATTWASPFVPLDRAGARTLVDPAAHARPTIVALWSSDCGHCKKNLALFARLVRSAPRWRLVTVATETESEGLAAPLDRLEVPGRRYVYGGEAPEAIAHALDPAWRGELPRTLFFDGRGGRVALSGVVDAATIRRALGGRP